MRNACLAILMFVVFQPCGRADDEFALRKDDVVVFLGGTNMLRLQQAGYLEAMLTLEFATQRPKFRDLSWEADTVYRQGSVVERWRRDGFRTVKGLGNLEDQLKRVGATVVIAQFGQLESLDGPERLDEFIGAYERLVPIFQKQARIVLLVTPPAFERPLNPLVPRLDQHNDSLRQYSDAIAAIAERHNVGLARLGRSESKPSLRAPGTIIPFTTNGMHIGPMFLKTASYQVAAKFGVSLKTRDRSDVLRQAVIEKHRLWYDYWRPANWKLLFGDDAFRQFTRGDTPFREEWQQLLPLIEKAEGRIWTIADGGADPGNNRPKPEILYGSPDADIEKELASFTAADGLQVNLFASEEQGLTSPLNLRWDPAGRMYVTVTTTYPHVFPGDVPNDKVIVLEDTDHDGTADKSTVFADSLNIPTGIEWGDGGVYIGQNTELLFLKDLDGDLKADTREILLSGFGNGDSHQTINSFVWSPDGELYFGHGDGCESRVETPWGISSLFNAGFYRLRPRRLQLLPFLEGHMCAGNPWGVGFDAWGQAISVDGAGGVNYLVPGLIATTHRRRIRRIGNPGGYCGVGYIDGRHLPESIRDSFVTGDFKANRVKRFELREHDGGYELDWKEPLLQSKHRNFRPVDVKIGPDGAVYVVDWYNPITCHQDDAYRHPDRDKAHGRIWRISSKASPVRPPDFSTAPIDVVLDGLKSEEHWTRYHAKRALTNRDSEPIATALDFWVKDLNPKHKKYERHLFEALSAFATIEVIRPELLERLLNASDHRARAFATRLVGRWHDRLSRLRRWKDQNYRPLDLLAKRVKDAHPLVRMEAVVACAAIPSSHSIEVAAQIVDQPMDGWIEYSFNQAVHHLREHWLPALQRGDLSFESPIQLAAVLNEAGGGEVLVSLKQLVNDNALAGEARASTIAAILAVGSDDDWHSFGLDPKRFTDGDEYNPVAHSAALRELVRVTQSRTAQPADEHASLLKSLIGSDSIELQSVAIQLAGNWLRKELSEQIIAAAQDKDAALAVRSAAFAALVDLQPEDTRELLMQFAAESESTPVRVAAIDALARLDLTPAAGSGANLLIATGEHDAAILSACLNRDGGASALALALRSENLTPDRARDVMRAMFGLGRSDRVMLEALNNAIGANTFVPEFTEPYVRHLTVSATLDGDAEKGAKLFQSMACASCHRVSGTGGTVGPDLTAIGTTLSPERIIEEVVWPNRQVKEGYSQITVVTQEGRVHTGFERKTRESDESGDVVLEDIATRKLISIRKSNVDQKRVVGSAMPAGLTSLLTQDQLRDLIRYLMDRGRIQ